jgi:chromosome segregation ATPase
MNSGSHIPPYLLCERFAEGCKVADLFPVDDRGALLLSETAALVVLVGPPGKGGVSERLARITARPGALPLVQGAFDLVLALNPAGAGGAAALEELLKTARIAVSATGLVAAMIPNRETIGIDLGPQREYPDLMEFERLLRRHFPHVNVFGAQPLYGAVLTPLGRRAGAEPPVFDDRLLPDGGEPPTHFLALCSHRYQRLDDTTIAQVPFIELAEGVRARAEKLEGTLTVLRLENDARGREIEFQGRRLRELEEELARTQFERRDRASLTAELSRLEEAVRRRDTLLVEAQEALDSERRGGGARSEELLGTKLRLRQVEQNLADVELASEHASKERDEAEAARARLQSVLTDSAAESKVRQRELDDRMEVIAGLEVEVGALRSETSRLKQELLSAREAARRASADRSEIEESNARAESTAAQLARALGDAAAERERFDRRVEEIRQQLRSEATARAELDQERVSLIQRLEELAALRDRDLASTRQITSNARAAQERGEQEAIRLRAEIERATALTEEIKARLATADRERSLAAARLERQDQALADLRRVVAELSDEAGRRALLIETLTSRASAAEADAATLRENGRELHGALTAAEGEIADLRERVAHSETVADEHDKALHDMASLRAEVARIRPEANAAASARQRAATAEALLLERENASHALDLELTQARERAATAEALLLERENALRALEAKLRETRERTENQDRDLAAALEALAVTEETVDARMQTAAERIRAMRAEIKQLTNENETELLKVREDLETELRTASAQLERRDGEIWELKEEILRLHAQVAATVASQVSAGPMAEFQQSLADQENQIFTLGEERDRLRTENERLARSVSRAKKNVRILITLLRKERTLRREIAGDDAEISPTLSDSDLEMIAEIADPANDIDDMLGAIDARLSSRPAPVAPYHETAEEVDSVMESLRVANSREDEEPTEKTDVPGRRTRDSS